MRFWLVPVLTYVVSQRDRTRKVIERSTAGECLSSWHAHTERVFGPCQVAVLVTSSNYLPCTIIVIITDKCPAGRSKTGTAEAENTQDLAGPAQCEGRKSIYTPPMLKWQI